jgi:hypothetical protein
LQRYILTYLHEIVFGEFLTILTEWIESLVENIGRYQAEAPRSWTHELIRQLNTVSNKVSCAIYFWLNGVDFLGWLLLKSTLEESLVENSSSTKVWVMDPSLFDV